MRPAAMFAANSGWPVANCASCLRSSSAISSRSRRRLRISRGVMAGLVIWACGRGAAGADVALRVAVSRRYTGGEPNAGNRDIQGGAHSMMAAVARSFGGIRLAVAGMLLVITPAVAGTDSIPCDTSLQTRQVAQLLFGRNVEDQLRVSETEWSDFVAREVTPRFPDGFTIVDAAGQWRDARRGSILHEGSKLIEIVLPGGGDDRIKIEAIAEAYKRRFE